MTEQNIEKKKRKFSLLDNLIVIPIIGYLLIVLGQLLGGVLVGILTGLLPGVFSTDAGITSQLYLGFLGIWILTLLVFALIPRNRPMLKALGTKTKGNTPKMFAVGLGIGLGMNLLCALIAMINGDIALTGGANKTNLETLNISGGQFNGQWGFYSYGEDANALDAITVTGGTFMIDPTDYLATGYTAVESDGRWTVLAIAQ